MTNENCKSSSIKDLVIKMLAGIGQYHTANPEAKNPKPYHSISLSEIARRVKDPVQVSKEQAPWFIPSDFTGPLARVHSEQLKNGTYHALWADLDQVGSLTVLDVSSALNVILPGVMSLIYNTKSATPENQKCRIIMPLAEPCCGHDFVLYQKILNDKLDKAGIEPDRATERSAQLCYLPNRGEFYDSVVNDGVPLQ